VIIFQGVNENMEPTEESRKKLIESSMADMYPDEEGE
jgi:hypothetical protein